MPASHSPLHTSDRLIGRIFLQVKKKGGAMVLLEKNVKNKVLFKNSSSRKVLTVQKRFSEHKL